MFKVLVSLFTIFLLPQSVLAYYNPGVPTGFVSDFAGIINESARASLESELQKFEAETKHEIAVVTIKSLQGDTIENFAVKLFEDWQIGKKGADNGALFLIALEDRQMRIEVGYGLEGPLPDATAYAIINKIVKPAFQAGDYAKGITEGVGAIEAAVKGEDVGARVGKKIGEGFNLGRLINELGPWFFIFIFIILRSVIYGFGGSKRWWPGGVWGGVFGLVAGLIAAGLAIGIIFWILGFGIAGLLLDYVASKKGPFKGGRGGFWGGMGGFGHGGGFGGGGFGGFGGGGSGGGGSSGRW